MTLLTEQEILIKAYEAFNLRDIDTVLTYMHPDVDWPNGMEGGRVYGHEGVREYWTRQWSLTDLKVEPTGFSREAGGRIVVDVHQVVRSLGGNILADTMVQHIYLMREGLIAHMEIRD